MNQSNANVGRSDSRTRNYVGIVYPESAYPNWKEILAEECVPAVISPLHDKDVNPGTDETKKPHYHVMLCFGSVKTQKQAQAIFDKLSIKGVQCKPVSSVSGQARYLIHMDNPEKYQYNADDVVSLNGADWSTMVMTSTDIFKTMISICEYCRKYNIVSYSDLCDFTMQHNFDWFRIICSHTVFFKEYLKSRSWTAGIDLEKQEQESLRKTRLQNAKNIAQAKNGHGI
uniref:Replication protein n=1 Tax=uncultured prokaryote TaxID=198431 RepID=A0A0H5QN70_9ZZZZ|nr:hypothetical protein [uncultured prokaryote]